MKFNEWMKFNPETTLSKDIIYFPMIRVHLVALQFFGSFPNSTPLKYVCVCVCVCVCVHMCVSVWPTLFAIMALGMVAKISHSIWQSKKNEAGEHIKISSLLREMESWFSIQESDVFSGWEGHHVKVLCETLRFEWRELRKALWGWLCF